MLDPTLFNFTKFQNDMWITLPLEDHNSFQLIGCYRIFYSSNTDCWNLEENYTHNSGNSYVRLYYGRIPTNEFAFELFKNLELDLPVITRELKINDIL